MGKVVFGHHNLLYYLVVLLTFLCASPSLVGGVLSKFAIIILIVINLCFFKVNRYIYLVICSIASLFLIKYLIAIENDGDNVDLYPFVMVLHLYFLISYPFGNKVYFEAIKSGVGLCFYLGFMASVMSFVLGKSDFLFPLANKGLPNIYAFEGFTTTPQAFASLAILMLMFNYKLRAKFKKILPLLGMLFSINRTVFLGSLLVFFYRFLFFLLPVIFLGFIFVGLLSFDAKLFTWQTLSSRIDMLTNVGLNYFSMGIGEVTFGTFMSPSFEVHSAGTKYIENGIMFILYYFGLIGFFIYSSLFVLFVFSAITIRFDNKAKIILYFILVAAIVPMLTHEFLYISFYISMLFIIEQVYFVNYNKR